MPLWQPTQEPGGGMWGQPAQKHRRRSRNPARSMEAPSLGPPAALLPCCSCVGAPNPTTQGHSGCHRSHQRMAFRLLWRKTASCSSALSRPMEYTTAAWSGKTKRIPTDYWRLAALQFSPGWLCLCWGYCIVHYILENSKSPRNNFRELKQMKNVEQNKRTQGFCSILSTQNKLIDLSPKEVATVICHLLSLRNRRHNTVIILNLSSSFIIPS